MAKRKHLKTAALAAVILLASAPVTASAGTPYNSYNPTQWRSDSAAPDCYEPVYSRLGEEMGTTALREPADICTDRDGNIYILDKGNNRIVKTDSEMNFVFEITRLKSSESAPGLAEPSGIFVDERGFIYVADTENNRGIKLSQQGEIITEYLRPDDSAYTSEIYKPVDILADSDGMVYIISQGVYEGILLFDADGAFVSFYGSARVEVTAKLLLDRLWKTILSKDQRDSLARYVPTEYSGMDVDAEGFIYTAIGHSETQLEQIRKLNYLGNNIFPADENYGEPDIIHYKRDKYTTVFCDITVDSRGFICALDATRGRVYVFDQEGSRLMTFGTVGEQLGSFRNPAAIASHGDYIFVLDAAKANVTAFKPYKYGELIRDAAELYNDGQFEEAAELWEELLAENLNLEMAYNGIGKSYMKSGDYKRALNYFRLGFDRENESAAYALYRAGVLRKNIILIIVLMLVLLVALVLFTNRKFLDKIKNRPRRHKA